VGDSKSHFTVQKHLLSFPLSLSTNETILGNHIKTPVLVNCLSEIAEVPVSMAAVALPGRALAVHSVSNVSPVKHV